MSILTEIATIRDRLFDLSDAQFAQLVDYVERAGGVSSARAFTNDALAAMRPRLRVSRPPRRLTPLRVFCRPFEDLFYDSPLPQKRLGQIARRAIMPCWTAVSAHIDRDLLAALERDIGERTIADPDWASTFGPRLWPAAAEAARTMLAALQAGPSARAALIKQLGDEAMVDELADMARMLAIAEIAEELRYILSPKPLARLDESLALAVAAQFDALAPERERLWDALAWFVIARMADPVELARAYGGACKHAGLHMLGVTASKVTIARVGAVVGELAAATRDSSDIAEAVASRGEAVADQLAQLRDGVRDRRFAGSLAEIEKMREGLCSAVARNVLEGSGALIADAVDGSADGAPPDEAGREALRESAEARAHALWKCARFAGKIGLDGEVRATIKSVEEAATRRALEQLQALESGIAGGVSVDDAHASLIHAVRVIELVAGSERADALRLRGIATLERLRAA
jgi:hypothetical protein